MPCRPRSRAPDDLGALALERLRDALAEAAPDACAARERQRQQRRALRREAQRVQLLAVGTGLLVGGLTAQSLPTPAAVGLGLIAGGLVLLSMRRLRPLEWWRGRRAKAAAQRARAAHADRLGEALGAKQAKLVAELLEGARRDLDRLAAAAAALTQPGDAAIARRLELSGGRLIAAVEQDPAAFATAQRLLTHYFEKAAYLVERLQDAAEPEREGLRLTLSRMDNLFERVELRLRSDAARDMALELRLINQSLDEDLGGLEPLEERRR